MNVEVEVGPNIRGVCERGLALAILLEVENTEKDCARSFEGTKNIFWKKKYL